MGDYVLGVTEQASARPAIADPFADLLPPTPAAQPQRQIPAAPPVKQPIPFDDPFAIREERAVPRSGGQPGAIPADFDPFAETIPPPRAGAHEQLPDDPLDLTPSSQQNVDSLFGLKGNESWDPLALFQKRETLAFQQRLMPVANGYGVSLNESKSSLYALKYDRCLCGQQAIQRRFEWRRLL